MESGNIGRRAGSSSVKVDSDTRHKHTEFGGGR